LFLLQFLFTCLFLSGFLGLFLLPIFLLLFLDLLLSKGFEIVCFLAHVHREGSDVCVIEIVLTDLDKFMWLLFLIPESK